MKFSRVHKSLSKTGETQQQSSQFAPRPFGIQAKNESVTAKTQEDIENQTFAIQQMEATKLKIQAKFGSITPEGQERLDVLQAQMNGLLLSRVKTASQFGHNIANISPKRLDTPAPVQAKLTIGEPGDKYEQEADETARQVVQQIHQPQSEKLQRESSHEEEELQMKLEGSIQRESLPEEELQMKSMVQRVSDGGIAASPDLETSIQQARGSGQPLAENIKSPMEQAFGADFSGVKVHTDTQADKLNQSIQAKAFTTGQDVFFRQGEYNPGSRGGQELIAHELTHVVQQTGRIQRDGESTSTQTNQQPSLIKENDFAKADNHLKEIKERIKPIKTLNNENFIKLIEDYVEGIKKSDARLASQSINAILSQLQKIHAFEVGKEFYMHNQADPAAIEKQAQKSVYHGELWSKINEYMSINEAESKSGVSLESSLAGSLFDGLDFGGEYNFLKPYWTQISENFVQNLRGVVHVRMFRAVHPGSVFSTTEWPIIQKLMEAKPPQVIKLVVHVYDSEDLKDTPSAGNSSGEKKHAQVKITNYTEKVIEINQVSDFETLPEWEDTFKEAQDKAQKQQREDNTIKYTDKTGKEVEKRYYEGKEAAYKEDHQKGYKQVLEQLTNQSENSQKQIDDPFIQEIHHSTAKVVTTSN